MTKVKCYINEVKKVEGEFYEVNVEYLKQNLRFFVFNFREKMYLFEEKSSRVSLRVKDSIQFTLSNERNFDESLEILTKNEYVEIML